MRSRVAGVAGSARVRRLDAVGLAKAEAHGKRDDWSSRKRRVRDVPPVTLNSAAMGAAGITHDLDLRQRYAEHVAGAKLHGADTIALHMFVQFPTALVPADQAEEMVNWAVGFAKSVFGEEAVFSARCDRDEAGLQGVDLFLAPIYQKTTKRNAAGTRAVSTSRHLKELAVSTGTVDEHNVDVLHGNSKLAPIFKDLAVQIGDVTSLRGDRQAVDRYNRAVKAWIDDHPQSENQDQPRQLVAEPNLFLQGVALQTAFHRYLEQEIGLSGVRRGERKRGIDSDWKSPEHFAAMCELDDLQNEIRKGRSLIEEADKAVAEAKKIRDEADKAVAEAKKIRDEAEAIRATARADATATLAAAATDAGEVRRKAAEAEAEAKKIRDGAEAIRATARADATATLAAAATDAGEVRRKAAEAEAEAKRLAEANRAALKEGQEQARKDKEAAAEIRRLADLDRAAAADERKQATADREGVLLAINLWLSGLVDLAGNSGKPDWTFRDAAAAEKFGAAVRAAGRAAWLAVMEVKTKIQRMVDAAADEIAKAVTPEYRRSVALATLTAADREAIVGALTDEGRKIAAQQVTRKMEAAAAGAQETVKAMSDELRDKLINQRGNGMG